MNDKALLTQKDLDLVKGEATKESEKTSGGVTGADSAAKVDDKADSGASKGADKAADESKTEAKAADDKGGKTAGRGGLLDDLDLDSDDDDDAGKKPDKKLDKSEDKKADDKSKKDDESKAKDADDADDDADKKEDKKADGDDAWRTSLAERLLKGQEDKLSASKFSKARDGILKDLARFKTPEDYMAAGYMARQKIRTGEYKSSHPGAEGTPEEIAAWRKANDIPDEATGYELPQIPGFKWEDEKPLVDAFLGVAHEANLTRAQVKVLAEWQKRYGVQVEEEMEERMVSQDREDRDETHDDLRKRYGIPDFKPRMRVLDRLLSDEELLPDGRGRKLMEARYYDPESKMWRRVLNDPHIAALLIDHAEFQYGDVGFTPNDTVVKSKGRIEELEKMMKTDYDTFTRPGANGQTPADELLELQRKQEERKGRGRRAA